MRTKALGLTFSMLLFMGASHAYADTRVALVVGNSAYKANAVKTATNNATAISKSLIKLGFEVVLRHDVTRAGLQKAVGAFSEKLTSGADIAVFYYAGRGVQTGADNWLFGVDIDTAPSTPSKLSAAAYPLAEIRRLAECKSKVALVFLDAPRTNPFKRGSKRGTAYRASGTGCDGKNPQTMISYATSPGSNAIDGDGDLSPYTAALLKHIETADTPIHKVMRHVRRDVLTATNARQTPWESSTIQGSFKLN